MSQTYLQINPTDNLLVALQDLPKGTVINHHGNQITLQDDICLLYTSPSPRDYAASRMPSSA